jgi:hypothetical protein
LKDEHAQDQQRAQGPIDPLEPGKEAFRLQRGQVAVEVDQDKNLEFDEVKKDQIAQKIMEAGVRETP